MPNESGEPCSKVVAAEALGHDKGDLGTAQECGGVDRRGEKPSSVETPTTTLRKKPAAARDTIVDEKAGNDEAASGGSSRLRGCGYDWKRVEGHERNREAVFEQPWR